MSDLSTVRVLWRQPDTLTLWGIPYDLRPGQSPRDLWNSGNFQGWIYLGEPGWFSCSNERMQEIETWLEGREVPLNPYEWCEIRQ